MGCEAGSAFLRVIAHDQICLIRLHVCSIVPPVATGMLSKRKQNMCPKLPNNRICVIAGTTRALLGGTVSSSLVFRTVREDIGGARPLLKEELHTDEILLLDAGSINDPQWRRLYRSFQRLPHLQCVSDQSSLSMLKTSAACRPWNSLQAQ